jgi:hypothetical protein
VKDFVEQCRREWTRLRVPKQVADEMAADLTADLKEAEAEGASVEDVLGSGADDARVFAAAWAAERGVIPPARMPARLRRSAPVVAAVAALTTVAAVGAALVLFASPDASPSETAIRVPAEFRGPRAPAGWPKLRIPPSPSYTAVRTPAGVWTQFDGRGVLLAQTDGSGVEINKVGSVLLVVGLVGVVPAMLFLLLSARPRRDYSF